MKLETFFEHFDLLTDAPNAAAKLRELVLQLAVRGKLVEQDPEDESASKVVEKLKSIKERLTQEKKLRNGKTLSPIEPIEVSYFIPNQWAWTRFGDVTICRDGERIPLSKDARFERRGEYDYYGASGVIDKIDDYLFDKPLLLIGEDGANLINRSTPIAFIADGKYWVNNHAHVLDSLSFDCLRYLEVFINAIDLKPYITGTAQPKMNQAKMNSIPVSLPPLAEQKRIVEACDRILTLCDTIDQRQQQRQEKLEKMNEVAIAQLLAAQTPNEFDTHWQRLYQNFDLFYSVPETIPKLRQAILQLAVQGKLVEQDSNDEQGADLLAKIADHKENLLKDKKIRKAKSDSINLLEMPFQVPYNWAWCRLNNVILDIEAGTSPLCEKRSKEKNEWGIIKISAISWNVFNPNENKALPVGVEPRIEFEVKAGDFLISRANTSQLVGKSVVVEETLPRLLINDKTLRVHFSADVEKRFFNLYNNSFLARQYYAKQGTGTSNSMKNINRGQIRNLPVPVPPLAEQKRIVAKVDRLMALCDDLETKLTAARAKREALMTAAARQALEKE
ncbi:MAG: restriction endonuclease subunit S [Leptolyngbya sp. SIO4C1]|nr:restriction endonuclease subunit S [Leptolyngbya sp. SIO4C1]